MDILPPEAKEYFRLIKAKLHFRDSFIDSPLVSCQATIGRGCRIAKSVQLNPGVAIGDYTYVNSLTVIGSGSIGKYCSVGYSCQIGMHTHPLDFLSTSPVTYGSTNILGIQPEWNDFPAPPQIGHDVWIGSGVHIKQAVRIGSGAVIGAGAIVTHDIPAYAIAIGAPAHVHRMRFEDKTIEKLLQWCWWDLDKEQLRAFRHMFGNPKWAAGDIPDEMRTSEEQSSQRERKR